jgi:hypothetical protein
VFTRSCSCRTRVLAVGLTLLFANSVSAHITLDEDLRERLIMGFSKRIEERPCAILKVRKLLNQGTNPEYATDRAMLACAIEDALVSMTMLLLDKGASV